MARRGRRAALGTSRDVERYGPDPGAGRRGPSRRWCPCCPRPGDRLIVTGDHGNDPTIGHAYHTREFVPVLIHRPGAPGVELLPDAASLADVGATAAAALGLDPKGPRGRHGDTRSRGAGRLTASVQR
ncbi:hypothetical protein [Streptomyces sp. KL116D]|uniref:hypothetical protein n=1 Tax=Streptomyces sp. KL116D TaxID=3045152 RepID=UPI003558370D